MTPEEREQAISNQPPQLHDNAANTVTTTLYDDMQDLTSPDPEPVQRLAAPGLHVFIEGDGGPEVRSVDSLVVLSDGTLFAEVDEEIVDPDETPGFVGFLHVEEPLRSVENARSAFEKTKL